jgi:hypothetical protein
VIARVIWVVATVALALGVWTVRVVWAGETELGDSDRALLRGDAHDATVHARRAASWYAPGAPHVHAAYRRLIAIAVAAEERRKHEVALFAWRAVRQAALDTRWFVTPHAADRDRAEREIARIAGIGDHQAAEPDQAIVAAQLAALAKDESPRRAWVIVLCVGLFTLAGALVIATRQIAAAGRIEWRRGGVALVVAGGGALAWLVALWQA